MSYTLTQAEFRTLKSRLTRARNSGDPEKVLNECAHAFAIFDEKGYPDDWHRWERASNDAQLEIYRARV
jgi:hypothetical protein